MKTLTPAYGRDYKTGLQAAADYHANKDFILRDITSRWDGKLISKADIGNEDIKLRFNDLRNVIIILPGA